jgi:hypothetical protein
VKLTSRSTWFPAKDLDSSSTLSSGAMVTFR